MHQQIAGRLTGPVTKWLVLLFWVIVLGGLGPLSAKLSSVQDNQASSWLPGSAESTKALDKLDAFRSPNDIDTTIVFKRASGLTAADLAQIRRVAGTVATFHGSRPVTTGNGTTVPAAALVQQSKDGQVAQAPVVFDFGKNGWNKMPDVRDHILRVAHIAGVTTYVAGAGGEAADQAGAFSGIDGKLLLVAGLVVVVILLVTYRSPILWILPVISAVIALFSAQGVIYLLAKHAGLTVNGQSEGILTVLVFGAGTDYALLLVARYREELRRHDDRHEAMAYALHRAAPAIIASALTVILGMLCLLVAEMNSTKGLGPVAAIGIAVGLLVMITLLPALLVIFGRWFFWPARPKMGSAEPTAAGFWARVGRGIAVRPRTVWIGTAVILAIACLGAVKLNPHGLSNADSYTKTFDSVRGDKLLLDHGLGASSSPMMVVAKQDAAGRVRTAMAGVKDLGTPAAPVAKDGVAFISAPMSVDPSSHAARVLVDQVRAAVHAVPGADALVGGNAAVNADVEAASAHDSKTVIPIVLIVVLLILMLLLRAILSPLILIATVVLSFGAAIGLSSLLFHYVFGFAGADQSFPLFTFMFLVALGIDYNIFLMTRVREETPARGTRDASLTALGATGGVITSAGLVLAGTFAALGTLPLVGFAEIGVAVALGVLLDTLVVRSVLVTALNMDIGSRIWWPSKLDRDGPDGRGDQRGTPEMATPERVL
jgi:RND superfamily putative drug exporter